MRCGCPFCEGVFMIHEDDRESCVCPECGYKCSACLGTNTVVERGELSSLADRFKADDYSFDNWEKRESEDAAEDDGGREY